jgi:hypothetical protein
MDLAAYQRAQTRGKVARETAASDHQAKDLALDLGHLVTGQVGSCGDDHSISFY